MIVEITASAERDLENIADYIARDSALAALRFIDALQAKCVDLGELPYAFPLIPRYEQHGIRRRVHGNYLILYRVDAERVVVLRILHGAVAYETVLFPD